MRKWLLVAVLLFGGIATRAILSETPNATGLVTLLGQLDEHSGVDQPTGDATSPPRRRLLDEEGIKPTDSSGRPIARITNVELTLTYRKTDERQLRPFFRIEYNFDNTVAGGKRGGTQLLYIDLVDSQGNIVTNLLKLDISQNECLNRTIDFQGFTDFDWGNINIQRMEFRTVSVIDPPSPC